MESTPDLGKRQRWEDPLRNAMSAPILLPLRKKYINPRTLYNLWAILLCRWICPHTTLRAIALTVGISHQAVHSMLTHHDVELITLQPRPKPFFRRCTRCGIRVVKGHHKLCRRCPLRWPSTVVPVCCICGKEGSRRNKSLVGKIYRCETCYRKILSERAKNRSRLTHCKRGHEFTDENTYVWRGNRHCRACMRKRSKEYYERKKARDQK